MKPSEHLKAGAIVKVIGHKPLRIIDGIVHHERNDVWLTTYENGDLAEPEAYDDCRVISADYTKVTLKQIKDFVND